MVKTKIQYDLNASSLSTLDSAGEIYFYHRVSTKSKTIVTISNPFRGTGVYHILTCAQEARFEEFYSILIVKDFCTSHLVRVATMKYVFFVQNLTLPPGDFADIRQSAKRILCDDNALVVILV